jgi:hypothetical protein
VLGSEWQLPDIFQDPLKSTVRRPAHGSIRIQEGEPTSKSHFDFPCFFGGIVKPTTGFDGFCSGDFVRQHMTFVEIGWSTPT